MKQKTSFYNFLEDKKIFFPLQTLQSHENVKVGGFLFTHNQIVRRDDILGGLNERMNQGFDHPMQIQIVPYVFTMKIGSQKVITRTLTVECVKDSAKEVKNGLMSQFSKDEGKWSACNS